MSGAPPISYVQAAQMAERVYLPKQKRGRYITPSGGVWDIDPAHNTRDYCVWVERSRTYTGSVPAGGQKAVLAFRGTSLRGLSELMQLRLSQFGFVKTADDVLADGLILAGRLKTGTRYAASLTAAREVVSRYGADLTTMVGHSLGGRLAIETALDTGAWCIAFAPGYSPFEASSAATLHGVGRGVGRVRALGAHNDIVSYAGRLSTLPGAQVGLVHDVAGAEGHGSTQYVDLFTPPGVRIGRFET